MRRIEPTARCEMTLYSGLTASEIRGVSCVFWCRPDKML